MRVQSGLRGAAGVQEVEHRASQAMNVVRDLDGWDSAVYKREMHARGLHVWTRHLSWWHRRTLLTAAPAWAWSLGGSVIASPLGFWIGTLPPR